MNLKELGEKIGLDEDEYRELVELFGETGMADYEALKTAFEAGDADQVARRAHTINGAAGNLGMMTVHETAKRIELAAVAGSLASVSGDVDSLKRLFEELAASIGA
jgi:HPt (histidine-containing phosphotransfer) domain-containing protein